MAERHKKELTAHIEKLNRKAGRPSVADVYLAVVRMWTSTTLRPPSDEIIRRAHKGQLDPTTCDPAALVAIAHAYGADPGQLGPTAAERLGLLEDLVHAAPSTPNWCLQRSFQQGSLDLWQIAA